MSEHRSVYLVLSPTSLPYARFAIESLLERSAEPIALHLVTDTEADRETLRAFMTACSPRAEHRWRVYAESDLADREAVRFARYPHLRAFRRGHPCWRKITDPLLLADPGTEMVLLDPDLYFPNHFRFEATPRQGILLMWQRPNCLLPHATVRRAMDAGIALANHVDIGVAQWRGPEDLEWLDWLIGTIGGASLPRAMHVEAIVWAALAMKLGGGYLDPTAWHCWHRTQRKRLMRLMRVDGSRILRSEPWAEIKCFHGGGEAKWWIPDAIRDNFFGDARDRTQPSSASAFLELKPAEYQREQSLKRLLRGVGYYNLFRTA